MHIFSILYFLFQQIIYMSYYNIILYKRINDTQSLKKLFIKCINYQLKQRSFEE